MALVKGSGGLVKAATGLAKCPNCSECTYCSDGNAPGCPDESCKTPYFLRVGVSGLDAAACTCVDGSSCNAKITSFSADGTYDIPQLSACVWFGGTGITVTWEYWSNNDCTGSKSSSYSAELEVKIIKNLADYTIEISAEDLSGSGSKLIAFEGTATPATSRACHENASDTTNDVGGTCTICDSTGPRAVDPTVGTQTVTIDPCGT